MQIPSPLFFYLLTFLHQPVSRIFVLSYPAFIVLFMSRRFFSVLMSKGSNFNPNPLKLLHSNQIVNIVTIASTSILFLIVAETTQTPFQLCSTIIQPHFYLTLF